MAVFLSPVSPAKGILSEPEKSTYMPNRTGARGRLFAGRSRIRRPLRLSHRGAAAGGAVLLKKTSREQKTKRPRGPGRVGACIVLGLGFWEAPTPRPYPPPKRMHPPGVEYFGFWPDWAGLGPVFRGCALARNFKLFNFGWCCLGRVPCKGVFVLVLGFRHLAPDDRTR